jgi:hypothetical protein
VALTAGLRQVLRIDRRFGVARRQDIVNAVAAGAVRDGLKTGLRSQPVNEESKLTRRSEGSPNFRLSRTSPWQLPQVSRMCNALTGEAALVCLMILCSPWQSVQSGACVIPRAKACP